MTAEFAVALPAVLLLLALLLAGSAAGVTQLRLEEAARAGARALARGEGNAVVEGIVRRLAGESATVLLGTDGEWLSVTASARVGGPMGSVIPWTLSARASAWGEIPAASTGLRPVLGNRTVFLTDTAAERLAGPAGKVAAANSVVLAGPERALTADGLMPLTERQARSGRQAA